MSKAHLEQVTRAVNTHVFILCPNNSGSTYLSRALAASQHVWSLEREGQHVLGFAGPQTLNSPWPLIWGATQESLSHFRDSPDYDWLRTRKAWYVQAQARRPDEPFAGRARVSAGAFGGSLGLLVHAHECLVADKVIAC